MYHRRLLKLNNWTVKHYTGMKSKGAKLYLVRQIPFTIYQVGERKTDFRVVEKYSVLFGFWFIFLMYFLHEEKSGSMNVKMLIILTLDVLVIKVVCSVIRFFGPLYSGKVQDKM